MDALRGTALSGLIEGVRSVVSEARSLKLPVGSEFFYYNNFEEFSTAQAGQRTRIRAMLRRLPGLGEEQLAALEDPDSAEEGVEDALTDVLMHVSTFLDRHKSGVQAAGKRSPSSQIGSAARIAKKAKGNFKGVYTPEGSDAIPRPQDSFATPVDNSNRPFLHVSSCSDLTSLTATGPATSTESRLQAHARGLRSIKEQQHPLQQSLQGLSYMTWQLEAQEPRVPAELDSTPFVFVDTLEGLDALAKSLAGARELAVDLEAHQYRSFLGFTCLMQLSTREADWVVDTLALRDHIGPKLGPIFADAGVQKVFHGAEYDVQWLQRDFSIYMVNLFDTGQAARVLELPSFGLAFLMNHYCSIKVDKRYQMADWRLRPLPDDMLHYARMDTHYLLYISDRLKAELLAKSSVPTELRVSIRACAGAADNALAMALERSWKLCLKLYQKELHDETSYLKDLGKCKGELVTQPQIAVYAALFNWRNKVARESDESLGYILPRGAMIDLALRPPATRSQLLGNRNLSHLTSPQIDSLIKAVSAAKRQAGADEPFASTSDPAVVHASSAAAEPPGFHRSAPRTFVYEPQAGFAEREPNDVGPQNAPEGHLAGDVPSSAPSEPGLMVARAAAKHVVLQPSSGGGGLGGVLTGIGRARPMTATPSPVRDSPGGSASAPEPERRKPLAAKPVSVSGSGSSLLGAVLGRRPPATKAVVSTWPGNPSSQPNSGSTLLHAVPPDKDGSARPSVARPQFTLPFAMVANLFNAQSANQPIGEQEEAAASGEPKETNDHDDRPAGGESVSQWLEQHRQQSSNKGDTTVQERTEVPRNEEQQEEANPGGGREYEDYLPMSLNETYKKGPHKRKLSMDNHEAGGRGAAPNDSSSKTVVPFDYAAMALENPSLSTAFKPQLAGSKWRAEQGRGWRGRGRGRGEGGGLGGRGRGRASPSGGTARPASDQRRGMHEMDASDMLKGGKRSTLFPRSGNRTGSFK